MFEKVDSIYKKPSDIITPEVISDLPKVDLTRPFQPAISYNNIKRLPSPLPEYLRQRQSMPQQDLGVQIPVEDKIIYGDNPIKRLPSPETSGISSLPKGKIAFGEGFTVKGGSIRKGYNKSTGFILRTTPESEPMHVYVDTNGKHFIYEGSNKKFLSKDVSADISKFSNQGTLNNPIIGKFNPLNKPQGKDMGVNIGKLAAPVLIAGGLLLSSSQAEAKSRPDDSKRLALSPMNYTIQEEGFRGKKYKDSRGINTIGIGFNLQDSSIRAMIPKDVLYGRRAMTKEEAVVIFKKAYSKAIAGARSVAQNSWDKMSEHQRKALIDLTYNMGYTKVRGFDKMVDAIHKKDWERASKEMLNSKYAEQVPNRARRNSILIKMVK
jgi:lysozyme